MERVARWVPAVSLALALGAVAVSAYLTLVHYTTPNLLVCGSTGRVNCELVTTSAQSKLLGVPVALLGLLWSIGMAALCLPAAWRSERRWIHGLRLIGAIAGVGFVLWLVYAELFIIEAICLWCTVVHVLALALFVVVVVTAPAVLVPED